MYKAPRERVFAAWTIPAAFATWWGTESAEVPLESVKLDPAVGERWTATTLVPNPAGGERIATHWTGRYTEFDAPNRIGMTVSDDGGLTDEDQPEGTPIVVTFEDGLEGHTHMTLKQTSPDLDAEHVQDVVARYSDYFDSLARVLGVE